MFSQNQFKEKSENIIEKSKENTATIIENMNEIHNDNSAAITGNKDVVQQSPLEHEQASYAHPTKLKFEPQVGVLSLAERREMTKNLCTSSKVLPNGAWCLRSHDPPLFLRPNRPLAKFHNPADVGFVRALSELLENEDVVDLGAGLGTYGMKFEDYKRKGSYIAFDGSINIEDFTNFNVNYADLTTPLKVPASYVMSFEVGEHVPKQYESIYVGNIVKNALKGCYISWALPKQGGHGHVNEKTNEEVIAMFKRLGFRYNKDKADFLRSRINSRHSKYLMNTTLAFDRDVNMTGINTW